MSSKDNPPTNALRKERPVREGVSESGRYACGNCERFFCIECDVFAHEVVHNCPGCQSREIALKVVHGEIDVEVDGMDLG